tara:strand:- start:487 stop:1476 length:990 start_codon:yes stop_codon:yes gene_type:complete
MKELENLRIGVIGVGSMGQNHCRVYSEISNLVGVSDNDAKLAERVGEKFDVPWYNDFNDMLEHVDAVTVSVPTFLHHSISLKVIEAGVHLLVEKPLAASVEEAREIVRKASESNVVLAVGHIERHNPVIEYARNSIKNNEWGEIVNLSSRRVSPYPTRISDVGVIFDMAIHDIDVLCHLSDSPIHSVYASGGSVVSDNEDYITIILNFSSGIVGSCEASWLTPMKVRKLAITCSTHFTELDYMDQSIAISTSNFIENQSGNLFSPPVEVDSFTKKLPREEPLKKELVDFLSSITKSRSPLVTGEEGLLNVSIAQAALTSLKNNSLFKFI